MAELVAGYTQDNEPLAGIPLVELVHLGVIPGGRTSERCDILNKNNFSPQGRECKCLPRKRFGGKVVKICSHSCAALFLYSQFIPPVALPSSSAQVLESTFAVRELAFMTQDSSRPATRGLTDMDVPGRAGNDRQTNKQTNE